MKQGYSIGKMASLLGVTPGFLKYYEQNGLLHPKIDPTNGYRYYEYRDLTVVPQILKLKNLGFSGPEICHVLSELNYLDIAKLMAEKKPQIEQQIRFLKSCCTFIDTVQTESEMFAQKDSWSVGIHGDYYFLTLTDIGNIQEHTNINSIVEQWQGLFPIVSAAMLQDYRLMPKWNMKNGYAVKADFAREYNLVTDSPVLYVPKGRYLECYDCRDVDSNFYRNDPQAQRYGAFYNIHGIIEKYGFQVTGPSLFLVRSKMRKGSQKISYQRILTPIK